MYIKQLRERDSPSSQNTVGVCNQVTLLVLYYISSRLVTLLKITDALIQDTVNCLTPNDLYISRTTPLTSKRCILYIYSTNVSTENFKHALYSPFFSLQNAVCFIMLTCLVPVLFTFYIQSVLKLKKIIPAPEG